MQFKINGEKGFCVDKIGENVSATYSINGKLYRRTLNGTSLSNEQNIGFGDEAFTLFDGKTLIRKREKLIID